MGESAAAQMGLQGVGANVPIFLVEFPLNKVREVLENVPTAAANRAPLADRVKPRDLALRQRTVKHAFDTLNSRHRSSTTQVENSLAYGSLVWHGRCFQI